MTGKYLDCIFAELQGSSTSHVLAQTFAKIRRAQQNDFRVLDHLDAQ